MFHEGHKFVPEAFARQDPAAVPEVLKAWLQALQGLHQAHRIQHALVDTISTRALHGPDTKVNTPAALLQLIR